MQSNRTLCVLTGFLVGVIAILQILVWSMAFGPGAWALRLDYFIRGMFILILGLLAFASYPRKLSKRDRRRYLGQNPFA